MQVIQWFFPVLRSSNSTYVVNGRYPIVKQALKYLHVLSQLLDRQRQLLMGRAKSAGSLARMSEL